MSESAVLDKPTTVTPPVQPIEKFTEASTLSPQNQGGIKKENFLDKARSIIAEAAAGKKPEMTYTADTGAHGISQKGMDTYVKEQMEIRTGQGEGDDTLETDPRLNSPMGVLEGIKVNPEVSEAIRTEVERQPKASGILNDGTQFTDPRFTDPLAVKTDTGFLTGMGKGRVGEKAANMYARSKVDSFAGHSYEPSDTNPLPKSYKEFLNKQSGVEVDVTLPNEYQRLLEDLAKKPPHEASRVQLIAIEGVLENAQSESNPVKRSRLITAALAGVAALSALIQRDSLPPDETYTYNSIPTPITTSVGGEPSGITRPTVNQDQGETHGPFTTTEATPKLPPDELYSVRSGDSISAILNEKTGGKKYGENYENQDLLYTDIGTLIRANREGFTNMTGPRKNYYDGFYNGLDSKEAASGKPLTPSELKEYLIETGGENQFFDIEPGDKLTIPGSVLLTASQ